MVKKKDSIVLAPSAEVPAEKKKRKPGRPKKAADEKVTPKKKAPSKRTKKQSELDEVKVELDRVRQRIEELTNERDNALTQVGILKKELEEGNVFSFSDNLQDLPEIKTPYWYVRAALGPEKFVVVGTVWCDGFWDRTRFLDGNFFTDEKSAISCCQQKQQTYDRRWPR